MKEILKNYILDNYGAEMFQDIIQKNYLQYQYVEEDHNVKFLLNKANVILLQNELIRVAKRFHENDIKYIAFKGAVLANRLYENIYTRFFSDIDIYVLPGQFGKALTILYEDGYILRYPNALSGAHHVALKKENIVLELHKNILNPFTQIDETYLRKHTENMTIYNEEIRTFDVTATLLHLFYHLYMDTWLNCNFHIVLNTKHFGKANRFLCRAYEIALFLEKYFDEIKWDDIIHDIKKQKLRIIFKKMLYDILEIFPEAFPKQFIDTVDNLNYVDDERDAFLKNTIKNSISEENISSVLSDFINTKWIENQEKNIQIKNNGEFALNNAIIKDEEIAKKYQLVCVVNVEKVGDDVKLEFKISNDDFCFSEIGNYDTQASDGVHLIICGTERYYYSSIFLFPKEIDNKITVVPVDVLNSVNREIDENFISAAYNAVESEYKITAILKKDFLREYNLEKYFYLGLVISDCSSKNGKRKSELILSEPHSEWYNPIHFAKIELK